jgi:hypothetical protein
MNKRAGWMDDRTANILVIIYFFLAGIYSLNFLGRSVAAYASGIAFLIASTYGVVAVFKGTKFFA